MLCCYIVSKHVEGRSRKTLSIYNMMVAIAMQLRVVVLNLESVSGTGQLEVLSLTDFSHLPSAVAAKLSESGICNSL